MQLIFGGQSLSKVGVGGGGGWMREWRTISSDLPCPYVFIGTNVAATITRRIRTAMIALKK